MPGQAMPLDLTLGAVAAENGTKKPKKKLQGFAKYPWGKTLTWETLQDNSPQVFGRRDIAPRTFESKEHAQHGCHKQRWRRQLDRALEPDPFSPRGGLLLATRSRNRHGFKGRRGGPTPDISMLRQDVFEQHPLHFPSAGLNGRFST